MARNIANILVILAALTASNIGVREIGGLEGYLDIAEAGDTSAASEKSKRGNRSALLIIDVQDCFLEKECTSNGRDGSLAVPACKIIDKINALRDEKSCLFQEVFRAQDFHPKGHISFGPTHGIEPFAHLAGKGGLPLKCVKVASGKAEDASCCPKYYINNGSREECATRLCPPEGFSYDTVPKGLSKSIVQDNPACTICKETPEKCFNMWQEMWTNHCLQDGDSGFAPGLVKRASDTIVQKGTNRLVDAYSAFMDNTDQLKTDLDDKLQAKGITHLYVVGIATDVCVKETVLDALGVHTGSYTVTVIMDATASVMGNPYNFAAALGAMNAAGATIKTTEDVLAEKCPESQLTK